VRGHFDQVRSLASPFFVEFRSVPGLRPREGVRAGLMGRCSNRSALQAYSDQLVDLPNSPSSTTSMQPEPVAHDFAMLSVRNLSYDRSSTARPLPRAYKIKQLCRTNQTATCVVSIRFVLRFIPVSLKCPDLQRYFPRLNSSIRGKFQRSHRRRHQSSDWLFWNPIGRGRDTSGFLTTSS